MNIFREDDDSDEETSPFYWMEGDSLAPPCQTEPAVIEAILELAAPTSNDILYDLGCGDGRICIEAVDKYNVQSAVGVEIEPILIERFERAVEEKQLQDRVEVHHKDLLLEDLSKATIIILYLLPEALEQINDKIVHAIEHKSCRVVCNTWGLPHRTPTKVITLHESNNTTLLLYEPDILLRRQE